MRPTAQKPRVRYKHFTRQPLAKCTLHGIHSQFSTPTRFLLRVKYRKVSFLLFLASEMFRVGMIPVLCIYTEFNLFPNIKDIRQYYTILPISLEEICPQTKYTNEIK